MATNNQINYLRALYDELGQEPETDIESLSVTQASELIKQLKSIKGEVEGY